MKAEIITIGNSRGIRIPKLVLEQCGIKKEISLEIENDRIVITPAKRKPRSGWDHAFGLMGQNGDDALLIDDKIGLEMEHWKW
jgi:antitoxin MazE